MILSAHDRLRQLPDVQATEVAVKDSYGNVVAIVCDLGNDVIQVRTAGDADFNQFAARLGLEVPVTQVWRP